MIRKNTKAPVKIYGERGIVKAEAVMNMVIDSVYLHKNIVFVNGYYWYLDANGEIVRDSIIKHSLDRGTLEALETANLEKLPATQHLYASVEQRLAELTVITLQIESGENYDTVPNDWEDTVQP